MNGKNNIVGITIGDLYGIGAEITVKALSDKSLRQMCNYVIYGTQAHLQAAADMLGVDAYWRTVPQSDVDYGDIEGVVLADYCQYEYKSGFHNSDADSGRASLQFCFDAINAALAGSIDAVVTAPINKVSWKLAGGSWPGHTELLAQMCGSKHKAMMFVAGRLRLALATIHEALFEIREHFTIETITEPLELFNHSLSDYFGIDKPLIAVSALNPHAGEDGRFGDEEIRVIKPAIEEARRKGINAVGPFPADTLFLKASQGAYDGVLAMYHDQGMIPIKLLSFSDAVNVTIGLPIIRTSPAHGTAFDIAGKGVADASSMAAAIRLAADMAKKRRK